MGSETRQSTWEKLSRPGLIRSRLLGIAVFVLLPIIAGASTVAIRVGDRELAPFWGAGLRFLVAAVILMCIVLWRHLRFPRGSALAGASLVGFLNIGVGNGLLYLGLTKAPAGFTQLIMTSIPLMTLGLARLHRVEPFRLRSVVGAVVGILGVAIMLHGPGGGDIPLTIVLSIFGAAACTAESFVLAKKLPSLHPVTTNAVGMTVGATVLIALSVLFGERHVVPRLASTWYSLGFNVLFASVVFFALYVWVIRTWGPSTASYILLASPVAALGLGAVLASEHITSGVLAGGALVIAGVYVGGVRALSDKRSTPVPEPSGPE